MKYCLGSRHLVGGIPMSTTGYLSTNTNILRTITQAGLGILLLVETVIQYPDRGSTAYHVSDKTRSLAKY